MNNANDNDLFEEVDIVGEPSVGARSAAPSVTSEYDAMEDQYANLDDTSSQGHGQRHLLDVDVPGDVPPPSSPTATDAAVEAARRRQRAEDEEAVVLEERRRVQQEREDVEKERRLLEERRLQEKDAADHERLAKEDDAQRLQERARAEAVLARHEAAAAKIRQVLADDDTPVAGPSSQARGTGSEPAKRAQSVSSGTSTMSHEFETAHERTRRRQKEKLERELIADFIERGLRDQELEDTVVIALNKAVKTAPKLGQLMEDFAAGVAKAKNLLAACRQLLQETDVDVTSKQAGAALGEAEAKILAWRRVRSSLQDLTKGIKPLWYRPVPNDTADKVEELVEEFETTAIERKRLVDARAAASAPATTATPFFAAGNPADYAMALDISKYIPDRFSGEGEAAAVLKAFRTWLARWKTAEEKLKTAPHATKEAFFAQLLLALDGTARALVNDLLSGSYDAAMDLLVARYGDIFKLAA